MPRPGRKAGKDEAGHKETLACGFESPSNVQIYVVDPEGGVV